MWRARRAPCFAVIPGFTFRRTSITHSTVAASAPASINSSHSVVFRTSAWSIGWRSLASSSMIFPVFRPLSPPATRRSSMKTSMTTIHGSLVSAGRARISLQVPYAPCRNGCVSVIHVARAEVKDGPNSEFVYAKIGCYDAFAFPELLPGSIVRVAKQQLLDTRKPSTGPTGSLFLVEHAKGLVCSKLYVAERNRIVLCPSLLPFAQVEMELGREVRVVGTVDFELRSTAAPRCPKVPLHLARFWIPGPLEDLSNTLHLDRLLRRARQRSGLTFREASAKSGLIARVLGNKEFFCAPGSLSDYETATQAPRHIHKMFSLCVLYSLNAWEFMNATGLRASEAGKGVMPDELLGRAKPFHLESASDRDRTPSVESETAVAEFPYFFGSVVAELLNLPHLSIRDVFWVKGPRESFHPYFRDAVALIVDRRKKRIATYRACPLWAQPSYILLGHEGNYVCASCGSDGRTLITRPFSNGFTRPVRFRRPEDVEVIGRVVGILRRLSSGELLGSQPV